MHNSRQAQWPGATAFYHSCAQTPKLDDGVAILLSLRVPQGRSTVTSTRGGNPRLTKGRSLRCARDDRPDYSVQCGGNQLALLAVLG